MTFKELREQKNRLQYKLDIANKTIDTQNNTIDTQNRIVDILQNQIIVLNSKLELEAKAKKRIKLKLMAAKIARDKNYNNFINEVAKTNKCRNKNIIIAILLIGIICAVAL